MSQIYFFVCMNGEVSENISVNKNKEVKLLILLGLISLAKRQIISSI